MREAGASGLSHVGFWAQLRGNSMAEKYRAVMLTQKGGPEVLKLVELPAENPDPGQLRVRI
jgi:hypothetical protein